MPRFVRILTIVLVVLVLAPAAAVARPAPPDRLTWGPCPFAFDAALRVNCAVLTVPETRGGPWRRPRRTVRLQVAVLHSPSAAPARDPIVFLDGGPSFNELNGDTIGFLASLPFAATRDIVLYNERGVGYSQPRLGCPELDQAHAEDFLTDPFFGAVRQNDLAAVAACRTRLAADGTDLRAYGSESDAADLDALRRALGYRRWNLLAWSADGVTALTAMRLYPHGLRSVILDSPVSNRYGMRGLGGVEAGNRMLEQVFAGCAADASCAAAHPRLRARFFSRVHALRAHPVQVELPVEGGPDFRLTVDDAVLLGTAACFDPFCAQGSPAWLELAAHGDLTAFMVEAIGGVPLSPSGPVDPILSEGKTAVFHCRDYIAFESDASLRRAARRLPEWRNVILNEERYAYLPNQSAAACRIWDVGRAERAQHAPVHSAIPTLILAGRWDGVIAPLESERIARALRRERLYEFPGTGHVTAFWDACPSTITTAFLDAPLTAPDASCVAAMPDVSFAVDPATSRARARVVEAPAAARRNAMRLG